MEKKEAVYFANHEDTEWAWALPGRRAARAGRRRQGWGCLAVQHVCCMMLGSAEHK